MTHKLITIELLEVSEEELKRLQIDLDEYAEEKGDELSDVLKTDVYYTIKRDHINMLFIVDFMTIKL